MKNANQWRPTKFIFDGKKLSPNVSPRSWLAVRRVADAYSRNLEHFKGRLLDLGCGEVPFYAAYRDRVSEIICVDWDGTDHDSIHVDQFCDLTRDLPFGEEFDTVLISDVLEHIPNPDNVWREIYRVIKPGGRVLLNVPFFYQLHEQPYDFYRYTEYALERFAKLNGFHVVYLESIGGVPEIIADILAKMTHRIPLVAMAIQRLALLLKPISRRTSATFPFGYFMVLEKPSTGA